MAKGTNQVTSIIKTNITSTPSLLNCVEDSDVGELNEHDLDKFLCTIKGETKKHFVALLEQLGEATDLIESHEETISELHGHSRDYADEIAELSSTLEEERTLRLALEESYNDDCTKMQKKLDHDVVLTRMLKSEKYALEVALLAVRTPHGTRHPNSFKNTRRSRGLPRLVSPKKKSFKKVAHKDKRVNIRAMSPKEFLQFRTKNHYLQERETIEGVENVWVKDHCRIYRDVIGSFKKNYVSVQWIDLAHLHDI
ncbi:hypothetical protein ZWY2020_008018 [Hordeum vulgare]|nr:hypothetical protein ZWY2020_008018 [Hordeum vulgare]